MLPLKNWLQYFVQFFSRILTKKEKKSSQLLKTYGLVTTRFPLKNWLQYFVQFFSRILTRKIAGVSY